MMQTVNPETLDLASLPWLPLYARSSFPAYSAIYFDIDSRHRVQYIGRTIDPEKRWNKHHRYTALMEAGCTKISFLFMKEIEYLPELEECMIDWFKPPLNKQKAWKRSNSQSLERWELRVVMARRKMTHRKLAELMQISPHTLRRWVESDYVPPLQNEEETINRLCTFLKCKESDLIIHPKEEEG